ncbi:MAG: hypothetical protein Q9166_005207 [cf. Caloplaca sp. 2 TL-2023]
MPESKLPQLRNASNAVVLDEKVCPETVEIGNKDLPNIPTANDPVAEPILPLSPSFSTWGFPQATKKRSSTIALTPGNARDRSSGLNHKIISLVGEKVTKPIPVASQSWSISSANQYPFVDLTEDSQPISQDSRLKRQRRDTVLGKYFIEFPESNRPMNVSYTRDIPKLVKRDLYAAGEVDQPVVIIPPNKELDDNFPHLRHTVGESTLKSNASTRDPFHSQVVISRRPKTFINNMPSPLPSKSGSVSLTEDTAEDEKEDIITEDEFRKWLRSQCRRESRLGRYGAQQSASVSRVPRSPTRNLPIKYPFRILTSYEHNGIMLRPGVNAELEDKTFLKEVDRLGNKNEPHASFIRIVDIIEDTRSQSITLRGWLFQRAQYLNGILEKKRNELCWVLHVDEDDARDMKLQAMETVPVEDVVRRRKIILTNQPWPKLSFREDISCLVEDSDDVIRNQRVLVCRFKYICYYVSADRRDANAWCERVLQRLQSADCDKWSGREEPCAVDDKELRKAWRGETVPGGMHVSNRGKGMQQHGRVFAPFKKPVDLTKEKPKPDPDLMIISSRISRSDEYHPQITNIATRIDWTTNDGAQFYTINGLVPVKRSRDSDIMTTPSKRHQADHHDVKYERPPPTGSMLDELRRKCSVFEVEPPKPQPQPSQIHPMIPKSSQLSSHPTTSAKRQYTFGDSFCGAGGMSRAAYQSELHIKYAFDCNKNACKSYEMNFPHTNLHCLWADEFARVSIDCKVDIAHLSPPCQFFSDAHTIAGKDDEMNTASLFAVGELLKKSKPRVVTLEQTFGIVLRARHQGYLNALVQVFTSHGFSIRWRLLHCADYGLPQMRLRTFMIASCPGEPLPPFPPPTHSSSPHTTGLLPWTTITATLSSIPSDAPDHFPHLSRSRTLSPQSGNRVARTITCNGGGQVHPNGQRDLTLREFASLQGFPLDHVFGTLGAKKQIGNAVPPVVGRQVLQGVIKALEKEDGFRK